MTVPNVRPLPVLFLLIGVFQCINADIVWPEYNQFCRDDAGPPYLDDEETFPDGGKYHDTSEAIPILQNGQCAPKMAKACNQRPNTRTAYFEGPIDCGGNGWFCRIMPDENWAPINLIADLNFGHCNTTDGIGDAGWDRDGHCHGSSDDNTYYWWMRDHYHRGYNGRLRCCCGWYTSVDTGGSQNLFSGRIANRCDYRKMLQRGEAKSCRDANEEHNLGYDDVGCDPSTTSQIGSPIPEDDSMCWEMAKFGVPPDGDGDDDILEKTPEPSSMSGNDSDDEGDGDGDDEECVDSKGKFLLKLKKEEGEVVMKKVKKCNWLKKLKNKKKRKKICKRNNRHKKFGPAKEVCPKTCKTCDEDSGDDGDGDGNGDGDGDEEEDDGEEDDGEEDDGEEDDGE